MSDLRAFDPGRDFPPDGAQVSTTQGVATFRDGTMPGWWLADGRYARPFSEPGLVLARAWATRTAPNDAAVRGGEE